MNYQHNFQAVLQPYETQIDIEAFLETTKNIFTPNYCGDYYFEFIPATISDHQRLCEMGEKAHRDCMLYGSPSTPEAEPCWEKKNGTFFVQQPQSSFAIKHNLDDERMIAMVADGDSVSLRLHFHDSPDGKIYLSCDYLNCYLRSHEQMEQIRKEEMAKEKNPPCDIDW